MALQRGGLDPKNITPYASALQVLAGTMKKAGGKEQKIMQLFEEADQLLKGLEENK